MGGGGGKGEGRRGREGAKERRVEKGEKGEKGRRKEKEKGSTFDSDSVSKGKFSCGVTRKEIGCFPCP